MVWVNGEPGRVNNCNGDSVRRRMVPVPKTEADWKAAAEGLPFTITANNVVGLDFEQIEA